MKRSALAALILAGVVVWSVRTDHDVSAQPRKSFKVTRLFTGTDGQTHAEDVDVKLNPSGNAGELSQMIKVSGLQFRRQTPNYFQDWHTAPRRQYVITLSGHGEVELAGGKKVPLDPGHILLAEDVTGKGHISRGVGTEDRLSLFIPVAE